VLVPGAAPHVVPLRGRLRPPVALAGDRMAFRGVGAEGIEVQIADWRTGAVLERKARGDDVFDFDLATDGRLVAGFRDSPFEAPRFAGDSIVAFEPRRFDASRPVRLDPAGGPPAPLGLPTTELSAFGVDAAGVAWVANGCVLYAPVGGTEPAEPPLGPCPRAEALVEEGDQTLRGRRIRFRAACVAAPTAGCRGTVEVRGEEGAAILGRGSFHVPMGARRRFDVVLNRRGLRYVNAGPRRRHAFLAVRVRMPGGRPAADGVSGAVVDRRR
jgi:hypothetical protein